MLELTDKNMKIDFVTIFHMFKKLSRVIEYIYIFASQSCRDKNYNVCNEKYRMELIEDYTW